MFATTQAPSRIRSVRAVARTSRAAQLEIDSRSARDCLEIVSFSRCADWLPLNSGSVRPTQGRTCAVLQVNGGSQSFNAVNELRRLARWISVLKVPILVVPQLTALASRGRRYRLRAALRTRGAPLSLSGPNGRLRCDSEASAGPQLLG